jgi:hypothetical protein
MALTMDHIRDKGMMRSRHRADPTVPERILELYNILGLLTRTVEYHFKHTGDGTVPEAVAMRLAQAHDSMAD